jgi:hypothetical protein
MASPSSSRRLSPGCRLQADPRFPFILQEAELVLEAGWEALEMAIHLFPLVQGNEIQLVRLASLFHYHE